MSTIWLSIAQEIKYIDEWNYPNNSIFLAQAFHVISKHREWVIYEEICPRKIFTNDNAIDMMGHGITLLKFIELFLERLHGNSILVDKEPSKTI